MPSSLGSPKSPGRQEGEEPEQYPESPIVPPAQPTKRSSADPAPMEPVSHNDMPSDTPERQGDRSQVRTPEPRPSKEGLNNRKDFPQVSPSTPGHLAPFDWEEFESRYEQALKEADDNEEALLKEFQKLVEVRSPHHYR